MKNDAVKKFCILILTTCLILGHIHVSASADPGVEYPTRYGSDQLPSVEVLKQYADIEELRAYLFDGFSECATERIELAKFNIPLSESWAVKDFIWREIPELFHVDGLRTYNNGVIVTAVAPSNFKFVETKEQYFSMLAECEEKAAVLLDGIIGNDGLSDVEKALLIHDRIAVNCEYCYDKAVTERYTLYGALVKGLAVCDGYTRAYSYLLRKVGIESVNCSSGLLYHAWNLVFIDGSYYHVDVTWDDPTCLSELKSGYEGYVLHNNFLLSDKEIKARKHTADDFIDTLAQSTKYDDYFWRNSETEFQLVKGRIYYVDNKSEELMHLNDDGASGTALCSVQDRWWASDRTYYWDGNYTRLSSDGYFLYYSSPETIYSYDPNGGEAKEIFKPELLDGDMIYGFTYSDGCLVIDRNDRPVGRGTRLSKIRQPYSPEKIKAELSVTHEPKDGQTVSAKITSLKGISGYYFGTTLQYADEDVIKTAENLIELPVTEPGVYYFVAFDECGESSEEAAVSFGVVNLHLNGGELEYDKILVEEDHEFTLPIPDHERLCFRGWTPDENGDPETAVYSVTLPLPSQDLYAVWAEPIEISGAVKTAGENITVTVSLLDDNGNVIGACTSESGEFEFDPDKNAAYVQITAPGHVGRIYKTDSFPADEIELDLSGDSNGDKKLNNKDVTVLFRALLEPDYVYSDAADCNGDGENDNKDVVLLFRYLTGSSVELIPHTAIMY